MAKLPQLFAAFRGPTLGAPILSLYAIEKKGVEVEAKRQLFGDFMPVMKDEHLGIDDAVTNFHILHAKKTGRLREVDSMFYDQKYHWLSQWTVGIADVDCPVTKDKHIGLFMAAYVQHVIAPIGLKYYTAERAYIHSSGMVQSPVVFSTKSRTASLKKYDKWATSWEGLPDVDVHRFVRDDSTPWTMKNKDLSLHHTTMWTTLITHLEEKRAREREALKEYEKQAPNSLDDATFARLFQAMIHRQP